MHIIVCHTFNYNILNINSMSDSNYVFLILLFTKISNNTFMTLNYDYSFNKTSNKLALLLNSKRTVILNVLEKVNLHI